jgi:hypothetical protein
MPITNLDNVDQSTGNDDLSKGNDDRSKGNDDLSKGNDDLSKGKDDQRGGARKRKIRLGGEHMNLQPSAPISGQKIRKIKPFAFKTSDQKKYLARLRSSPCRSATQKKCKGRKLRQSCKYARGTKRAFCRRRSNKNYRA